MKAQDLFDLRGRVVVITGAASGIGLAYAEVMAARVASTQASSATLT